MQLKLEADYRSSISIRRTTGALLFSSVMWMANAIQAKQRELLICQVSQLLRVRCMPTGHYKLTWLLPMSAR